MRNSLILACAAWAAAACAPLQSPGQDAPRPVLRVLNWSEYIDIDESVPESEPLARRSPTLLAFAAKEGCDIDYQEYEVENDMISKVQSLRGYYDVVILTARATQWLIEADRLEPLTLDRVPHRTHILPKYMDLVGTRASEFSLPYLIGTTGILYNEALVGHPITGWKDYFYPAPGLNGRIHVLNDDAVMISSALMFHGYHPNDTNADRLREAARLFQRLKREGFVGLVSSDVDEVKQAFASGRVAIGCLYSGDALDCVANDSSGNLRYIVPEEGCEFFVDTLAVLADAPQKDLAFRFVDHMLAPEIHAANAAYLGYICPNRASLDVLRRDHPDYATQPGVALSPEQQEGIEVFANTSEDIRRLWSKIFAE